MSSAGLFNLHVVLHHGRNTHHIVEAIFKAVRPGSAAGDGARPARTRRAVDEGRAVIGWRSLIRGGRLEVLFAIEGSP